MSSQDETLPENGVYRGRCPLCSGQLVEAGPGILACSADAHYAIRRGVFEAAWAKFDAGVIEVDMLIKFLRDGNTMEASRGPVQVS